MNRNAFLIGLTLTIAGVMQAQAIDLFVVSVPEKAELNMRKNTPDYVCRPQVVRERNEFDRLSNSILDTSPNGTKIYFSEMVGKANRIFMTDSTLIPSEVKYGV